MNDPLPAPSPLNDPANIAAFLREPGLLRAAAAGAGIAADDGERIARAAKELLERPDRLADLVRCATTLFSADGWNSADWKDTPRDDSAGEQFFLLLPLLQHLATMRADYAARGIPDEALQATLADFPLWIDTHHQRTGHRGFREIGWLREHVACRVIRLGRLQFQPATYSMPFVVLAHRQSGEIRVAACGGRRATASGVFADSEGAAGPAFELTFEEADGEIRQAHLVQPDGAIAREPTSFEPGAWAPRLAPGDPALALHIPAGAPLDFDACRASFQTADAFYPRHFADLPAPRAVICSSWLFYPGLAGILPATSNITRFQRAFIRVPLPGATANQTYERAFPPHGRAVTREQLATSLQRRLFDHIAAGHVPLSAGAICLPPLREWGGLI